MNRKVLLICYYFPPLGLGGVGRPLNLFRRLPEVGWDCHVLTVKSVAYRAYEPELLVGLDGSKIFRAGSLDPQRLMYLFGLRTVRGSNISRARSASARFFPDPKVGWVKKAVRLGRQLVENYRYDAIISTAPPISCHLIGSQLAKDFQLPWVADFRDYWTAYRIERSYDSPRMIARAEELKADLAAKCDQITAVNRSVAEYWGGGEVIYNAFAEELAQLWRPPDPDAPFTIGVVGHQHDSDSLETLYRMIIDYARVAGLTPSTLRILHVGQTDRTELDRVLSAVGPTLSVEITGRIPREQFVRRLSETSVITFGIPEAAGHDFVPGKLFDLLPSGRPLLIRGNPRGEVADIVKGWEGNMVFDDIPSAVAHLCRIHGDLTEKRAAHVVHPDFAREYSSERLAARFEMILNSIVNKKQQ